MWPLNSVCNCPSGHFQFANNNSLSAVAFAFCKIIKSNESQRGGEASASCYLSSAYAAVSQIWRYEEIYIADARCGFPSSNDLINPFYVLSWRRLRLAGNAGGCDLVPAPCLRLSAFAFAYSPAIHIEIQIVGVALSRHLLTAPLAALMIHSDWQLEQRQKKPKATPYSNSQPQLEVELKLKSEPAWATHTQSQTQTYRQQRRHCQYA